MTHTLSATLNRASAASNTWTVTAGASHALTAKLVRPSVTSNTWTVTIASAVTWDASEHVICTANPIAITGTTATMGGSFPTAGSFPHQIGLSGRATVGVTSGQKKYWETATYANEYNESGVGIIGTGTVPPWPTITPSSEALLGQIGGVSYTTAGSIYAAGALQASYAQFYTDGDNVGVAIDFDAHLMWVRVNGGGWNNDILANQNPATGTGGFDYSSFLSGTVYPGYSVYWSDNNNGGNQANGPSSCVGIFAAGSFVYTPPSGFSAL